jgi:hypothetical protein
MPLVYADRVQETTLTTGTGTLTLLGAVAGFQGFSVIGVGNTTYYTITDVVSGAWEVGLGTVGVSSLVRTTVLASSNANALVNLGVGSKSVFVVSPATFFANALSISDHASVNHTGLPGISTFTEPVHATTDHAALPGVGNLATAPGAGLVDHATVSHATLPGVGNLATAAGAGLVNHTTLNHAGIPGVPAAEAFTAGVHAVTDHTAITGAGGGRPVATSTTIPANSLSANGQMLLLFLKGTAAIWDGSITLNGISICDVNSMTGPNWSGSFMLTRTSSTTATVIGLISDDDSAGTVALGIGGTAAALDWTASQTVGVAITFGAASVSLVSAAAMK